MSDHRWTTCSDPAAADIIKWDEPLWAEPNKPRGKPDKIGEQRLTAKVLAVGDFVELEVLSVEKLSSGDAALKVRVGDKIRRKMTSLAKGKCQRQTGAHA